jgi:peptide/nickel transport system substrate-binding protein
MRIGIIGLVTLVLGACAAPPSAGSGAGDSGSVKPAAFKRIAAVIRSSPPSIVAQRTNRGGGSFRGLDGVEQLTNAGLSYVKAGGVRAAQLAEAVPNVENGLWQVLSDGRMQTTWKLRSDATWQDGVPLTADDLIFTAQVEQDRALEINWAEYELIEAINAPDARTITVTWKRPYIDADSLFSYNSPGLPMPKHLLDQAFNDDKANFLSLPYWSSDFIGIGAYQVREWVADSHMVMRVYDKYVFGRPKIDEIEVRFIPDNNTLLANMLAGADLTLAKTVSLDIALGVRDQWKDGHMEVLPQNWTPINPQFVNADPPIVTNYEFRKALLLALDRQELADFVFSGQGMIAHSYVGPDTPLYNLVEPSVVKYPYDPRQAAQVLQGLGFTKRDDGFLYDGSGRKLQVELRFPLQNDIHQKVAPPIAVAWQALGVAVDQVPVPVQLTQDREYRAQFPGFQIVERRNSLLFSEIYRFHSSQAPMPANRFTAPGFESRYMNAELDAALDRYATTVPMTERMQALAAVVHHQTEHLTQLPIFHGADPTLISNRLLNVTARGDAYTQAWNIQDWDVRD